MTVVVTCDIGGEGDGALEGKHGKEEEEEEEVVVVVVVEEDWVVEEEVQAEKKSA
ncbi:hypothetical protein E2C01_092729 [Portunus trituberculatus]|uniref:Uncharacterized protein n=1 Tax=Portunus trituberculatus TaxID=210409 RepID=A0A5B7JYH5_PORTR|nr:hypothetical protein [Portunus trituberculatus]